MLCVGSGAQLRALAARTPDLDWVAATGFGQARHQSRHVADMVGVQVAEEDLGRGRHGQLQAVEVGQRPGPQIEEKEVPLLVAHLD